MTPFTDIYSFAITEITDYKVQKMISADINSYYKYMMSLLLKGKNIFSDCLQSLDYISQVENNVTIWYFVNTLTDSEKSILADIVTIGWFKQRIQDLLAWQGKISDPNFKDMNVEIKQKSDYLFKLYEQLSRDKETYFAEKDNFNKLDFFGGL